MTERVGLLLAELKVGLTSLYGRRLKSLYLFGSYARGQEEPESDVDVLIVLDELGDYGAELDRTSALISKVSLRTGVSVSRVFVPFREWVKSEDSFLVTVREEAIPV